MALNVNNVQPKQSYGDRVGNKTCSKLTSMFSTIFIQKLHGGVVVKPSCCNAVELLCNSGIIPRIKVFTRTLEGIGMGNPGDRLFQIYFNFSINFMSDVSQVGQLKTDRSETTAEIM